MNDSLTVRVRVTIFSRLAYLQLTLRKVVLKWNIKKPRRRKAVSLRPPMLQCGLHAHVAPSTGPLRGLVFPLLVQISWRYRCSGVPLDDIIRADNERLLAEQDHLSQIISELGIRVRQLENDKFRMNETVEQLQQQIAEMSKPPNESTASATSTSGTQEEANGNKE